jgi:hypothetical protein
VNVEKGNWGVKIALSKTLIPRHNLEKIVVTLWPDDNHPMLLNHLRLILGQMLSQL